MVQHLVLNLGPTSKVEAELQANFKLRREVVGLELRLGQ